MNHLAVIVPGIDRLGGAERQAIELARGFVRRGWRVSFIALSGSGGEAAAELTEAGCGFLSLHMRKGLADPRGWWRFNRWLRAEQPDVVHAHLPHAAWMARWSRLAAPVRLLVDTVHSSATGGNRRRLGYRASDGLSDGESAVSRAAAEAWTTAGLVRPEKLHVIPNGVDTRRWQPDAELRAARRRELGIGKEFLWLAAGRLEPVKDYPTLLAALAVGGNARLAIAGDGPLAADLQQLAIQLGVGERVRWLGFEPRLERLMPAADGFVLSSRWEGLPMGLLEAAACALPSVATRVAGSTEAIVEGETGWLAPAADPAALAETMRRLESSSAAERAAMGARARQRAEAEFGLEAILNRWEALYAELLTDRPEPTRWARIG